MKARIHGAARQGARRDPVYALWVTMRQRCSNPRDKSFPDYGGRGIRVCARWESFIAFRDDMGARPPGTTLERIDNSKGYAPKNCRWAPRSHQAINKRNNIYLEHGGRRMVLSHWARALNIPRLTLYSRIKAGWPVARALTTPSPKR